MDDAKFCISCGADLRKQQEEADSVAPVAQESTAAMEDTVEEADNSTVSIDENIQKAEEAANEAASDMSHIADEALGAETAEETVEETVQPDYNVGGGYVGFAIASLVCGCLSILCCIGACAAWPLPIAAIALGVIAVVRDYDGRGFAIAGIVSGSVGFILEVIMLVVYMRSDAFM
jgi:hypothetical protein